MKPIVYFTQEITPNSLITLCDLFRDKLIGNVAVKLHSGEAGNQNFLQPEFCKMLIDHVGGTVVECNTAYPGERNTTEKHQNVMAAHGWYSGYVLPELAPSKDLLFRYKNGKVTKEDYRAEYLHQLDCVRWSTIVLEKLKTYGPDVILLCYEKSGDFCHRHILAEYLNDSGYKCEEYSLSTKYVKQS